MIRLREISVQLNIRECFFRTLIERIWRILQVCGTCFIKGNILVPWQDKGDLRRIVRVWGQVWEEKVYPHTYPHHWNPDKQGVSDGLWGCEGNKIKKSFFRSRRVNELTRNSKLYNWLSLRPSNVYTPYYYIGDGQRIAFVRVGDESIPATAEQMVRLVLKGTNKTYDSLHTDYKVEDYSFTILANTFKKRTNQEWDKKYLLSFGLVTGTGTLTNAVWNKGSTGWTLSSRN